MGNVTVPKGGVKFGEVELSHKGGWKLGKGEGLGKKQAGSTKKGGGGQTLGGGGRASKKGGGYKGGRGNNYHHRGV